MSHLNIRLSGAIELGAKRRIEEDVEIIRTDGGNEVRNVRTAQPLMGFTIAFPIGRRASSPQLAEVQRAYRACRGRLHSFDFKDWADWQATDEPLALPDAAATAFMLIKSYSFGSATHQRRVYRPVSPIVVKRAGVVITSGFTVDYTLGIINFASAPAIGSGALGWTGTFNVPVRFDGALETAAQTIANEHMESIELVEVRL